MFCVTFIDYIGFIYFIDSVVWIWVNGVGVHLAVGIMFSILLSLIAEGLFGAVRFGSDCAVRLVRCG